MIPPEKRKDLSVTLVVCPDLRRHLQELADFGALGDDVRSISDVLRASLPRVMARMEAGETLADSPYERVPNKLGVRLSFRHDEAFSERIGALWARGGGGRGARSVTAFWVELVGRAVALAREGALEQSAAAAEEVVAAGDVVEEAPVAASAPLVPDPGFIPPFLSPEEWEEWQRRFVEAAVAGPAAKPEGALVRRPQPSPASDPDGVDVLARLAHTYRVLLASHAGRPLPDAGKVPDGNFQAFMEEFEKLLAENLAPEGKGRKRRR